MWKNKGIAFKLILFFTASSAFIFLIVFGYNYWFSRKIIEKDVEEKARNLVLATVNRIEAVLRPVQKVPEHLAYFMEYGSCDKEGLLRLLREVVENNSEVYGSALAFEPYAFERRSLYFAPYFYKSKKEIRFTDLGRDKYQYFNWDWYQIPKELGRPDWSEPYYDEGGGNILMATYSVPFYRKVGEKRQFTGVVTADLSLETLQDVVSSIKVLETGYGFLISKNGTLVTHPEKELIMNETIFGVAESRGDAELREMGRKMTRGESGFVPFRSLVSEKPCWIYYTPIPSNGWSLAVLFPQEELMADINRLNRIVVLVGIAGLLLLSIAVAIIARSITHPLRAMARATEAIATGNLDIELPMTKSGDEVGKLSQAFQSMKTSLKEYIKQLTETTATQERIESELKIAHDIQMSILQKRFPPFPERQEFDIHAFIEPAREVGGDFYDFFFIDDDHLCFVIGDVSGKGVPASLFMAMTKTLIKATASKNLSPGEILSGVNRELNEGNDSCMFVTIFCGILNTKTGQVLYANGGHNSPLIVPVQEEATFLNGIRGLVVGAMEDSVYETGGFVLQPGELFFLYTDGVTEAMNGEGGLFSEARLKKEILGLPGRSLQEMIAGMTQEIASFSKGAPQSDDITMMMIRFRGEKPL
jgi:phosphoserine phosphatase RsbU/P